MNTVLTGSVRLSYQVPKPWHHRIVCRLLGRPTFVWKTIPIEAHGLRPLPEPWTYYLYPTMGDRRLRNQYFNKLQ